MRSCRRAKLRRRTERIGGRGAGEAGEAAAALEGLVALGLSRGSRSERGSRFFERIVRCRRDAPRLR